MSQTLKHLDLVIISVSDNLVAAVNSLLSVNLI